MAHSSRTPLINCTAYQSPLHFYQVGIHRFTPLRTNAYEDRCVAPRRILRLKTQALFESAFITVMPLFLLTGDRYEMGIVTSTYDYGTATFALVLLIVSSKVRITATASALWVWKMGLVWTKSGFSNTYGRERFYRQIHLRS